MAGDFEPLTAFQNANSISLSWSGGSSAAAGAGSAAVAVIGHSLWIRQFAADPHAVGRSLSLDGRSATVVGILPPGFDLPFAAEIWVPLQVAIDALPLQDRLDVRTVVGNASYPDVLERAGARDADMLIALTSSDEINMLACQIALTLFRTPTRIARIRARQLVANEQEHPDLFWAVRGGGGNFGVVTRFKYRLHPVGMILGGAVLLPPTADVLRGLVSAAAAAPRDLSTISFLVNAAPPLPFLAPEHRFKPALIVMFVYDGDPEAGQAAIAQSTAAIKAFRGAPSPARIERQCRTVA